MCDLRPHFIRFLMHHKLRKAKWEAPQAGQGDRPFGSNLYALKILTVGKKV